MSLQLQASDHQDGKRHGAAATALVPVVTCLVLAMGTIALYRDVGNASFINLDDDNYFRDEVVRRGLSLDGLVHAFTPSLSTNWHWHPLTSLSFQMDCQLFGYSARASHWMNVGLHALNAVLWFLLLGWVTGSWARSAFVAALFAWHPLHVESVAWVSERKDVLSTLFWILTTASYAGYVRRPTRVRYSVTLLLYVAGLLSKSMLVTLPFTLLLLDYWPLRRVEVPGWAGSRALRARPAEGDAQPVPLRALVIEKLPFFFLSFASCVVTFMVQRQGHVVATLEATPPGIRLQNALVSYAIYLWKTVWPTNLIIMYPFPHRVPAAHVFGALAVVLGLTGLVMCLWRFRYLAVGWAWYLGTLVPVIGLVQVGPQARADRYTYVPLMGIFVAVVWGVSDWASKSPQRRRAAVGVGLLALAAIGVRSRDQVSYWASSETVFAHAVRVRPDNLIAQYNLAHALSAEGRFLEAMPHYEQATRLDAAYLPAWQNMGLALAEVGQLGEAIRALEHAAALARDSLPINQSLSLLLLRSGELQGAERYARSAVRVAPNDAGLRVRLADILERQGKHREAAGEYARLLGEDPMLTAARSGLARSLLGAGDRAGADAAARELVALAPEDADAQYWAGVVFHGLGRTHEALKPLRKSADSGSGLACNGLAWILATHPDASVRDGRSATESAERAVATLGRTAGVLDTLAAAHAEAGRFAEARDVAGEAIALASASGDSALAEDIRSRRRLYESGQPFRDTVSSAETRPATGL